VADTNTANIGLLIADLNDVFNFSAHVEANFTTIDGLMGAVQCTSSTRPSNTYAGQIIYETDSKRYVQNTGTKATPVWTYMSHAAMAVTNSTQPTSGLTNGFLAYETDTGGLIAYNGGQWRYKSIVNVTSSTRPTTTVGTGTVIYENDTKRVLVSNGTTPISASWQNVAYANFVTTSSAHPSSPFTGLEIYETDTGATAVYTGSGYSYTAQQIANTTLGASAASVTFNNIPAYTRIMLVWRAQSSASGAVDVNLQIDGNTGNNYLWSKVESNSGTAAASHAGALTNIIKIGVADGTTTSYFANGSQMIDGWSSATGFLTCTGPYGMFTSTTADRSGTASGQFGVVGPHTSIKVSLSANVFQPGTEMAVYGLM
jgi:hypothetical protein